jgi:hypothetical protein
MIESTLNENVDEGVKGKEAIIFVHTRCTELESGINEDKLFLSMHDVVLTIAKNNLKKMISTSTVDLAFMRDEEKLKARIGNFQCIMYWFSIISKENN